MPLKKALVLIIFLLLIKSFFLYSQTTPTLEKLSQLKKLGLSEEESNLKKLKEAIASKDSEKIIQEFEKLGPFVRLSPEDLLMVAKAYFNRGNLEKAVDFAERVQSLRRGTSLFCEGTLLKIKALIILGKNSEAKKALEALENTFCKEDYQKEFELFKGYLKNRFPEEIEIKVVKDFLKELYETRFNYLLSKGNLKEAESVTFEYLNLTGEYLQGKSFFFKLAEAYFREGKIPSAKKYYQLIITEWDLTKEASISKFRLYQIAYERAAIKELLPPKTLEDLLMYITQIKTKYTDDKKLVEEASFLEVKINLDRKNWERVKDLSKDFLKTYPESKFLSQIKSFYCEASNALVPLYFLKGKVKSLMEIAEKERETLEESHCGNFYYLLGKEFFQYKFYGIALDYFLTAYNLKLSQEERKDLYLKLAFLADWYGEKEIFNLLWEDLNKNLAKTLEGEPLFLYLKAKIALGRNLEEALSLIRKIPRNEISIPLQKELYYKAFLKALEDKKYFTAYDVLNDPGFEAGVMERFLFLSETVEKAPDLFEKALKETEKRFPDNSELKFLKAYYLTKKGDLKTTQEILKSLADKKDYFSTFARHQQKLQELTQRIQEIVY